MLHLPPLDSLRFFEAAARCWRRLTASRRGCRTFARLVPATAGYPYCGPVHRGLIDVALSAISRGIMEDGRGARIAHVQDQALRAFRQPRGNRGCRPVRCDPACGTRPGRCRPRRRRHQAAHRAEGTGPVWRVPRDRAHCAGRTVFLRLRVCEERPGEPAARRAQGSPGAGKRDVRAGRSRYRGDAGKWDD